MRLVYKATTKEGKILRGVVEAGSVKEAAAYLRKLQYFPISINKKTEGNLLSNIPFFSKSGTGDLVFFTRQLSSMLLAGLTLMQALTILKEQMEKPLMREMVKTITTDVEAGKTFSLAIENYPEFFSPVYVSLVKAAENTGLLDKILLRIADNLEKQQRLKSTIKGALIYPVVVLIGMVVVIMVMMVVVIPQLSTLYKNLNVSLPLPTLIVLGISQFFVFAWPIMIGLFILSLYLLRRWRSTEAGRLFIDNFILNIPLIGKLVKKTVLTEFTRTLGLLVGSGSLVVESIRRTAEATGNALYKEAIFAVAARVEKGITIGDSLSYSPLFPPIVIEMVKIGEQTGKIDESLIRLSEYYEREVDQAVKTVTTLFEPIIIMVLGVGVAFLLIAVITPIYSLLSSFQ
ncbi:MAG: type II secretion system F family protein [Candidatus Levybacteria bacterium]|nr:type II secretion system F family protein [Candidatus Levybacteria bacterium]